MFTEVRKNRIAAIVLVPFLIGVEVTLCKEVAGTLLAIYSFFFNIALMKLLPSWYEKYHSVWNQSPILIVFMTILATMAGEFLLAAQIIFFGLICLYGIFLSLMLWSQSKATQ